MQRPYPPSAMTAREPERGTPTFLPAPEVEVWIREALLDTKSPLYNEDHVHLEHATIGVLWTRAPNERGVWTVAGQAEMPRPQGNRWAIARQVEQLEGWFGEVPTFVVTLNAPYVAEQSDPVWCAIVEHEIYHCGQKRGAYGEPLFNSVTGLPKFTIRPHDVEEFVGIVRRYGVGATAGASMQFVRAANEPPEIVAVDFRAACGTCAIALQWSE